MAKVSLPVGATLTAICRVGHVWWTGESRAAAKGRIRNRRNGTQGADRSVARPTEADMPVVSIPAPLQQARALWRNPDALLFVVGALGSSADERRWPGVPGGSTRTGPRRCAQTPCVPGPHTHRRNTPGHDRTAGRSTPDPGSGHRSRDEGSMTSAQWPMRAGLRPAVVGHWGGLCESTLGGVAPALTAKSGLASRLSHRPASTTHFPNPCHLLWQTDPVQSVPEILGTTPTPTPLEI
jgi:hypothetical protein